MLTDFDQRAGSEHPYTLDATETAATKLVWPRHLEAKKEREHEIRMRELWIKDTKETEEAEERAYQRHKADAEIDMEAHQRHMEQLVAENKVHALKQQKKQPQTVSTSPLNSREWEKACSIYQETDCIEQFLSTFERLCGIHKIPEDEWMPVLLTQSTG